MAGAAIDIGSCQCEILRHHNELSIVLSRNITTNQLKQLKRYFLGRPFGEGDLENIEDVLDLWEELNKSAVIKVQEYGELENALESIQAHCHIDVIKEYKEKMVFEGEPYTCWVTHNKETLTRAELNELKERLQPLMEDERMGHIVGRIHVYENAVLGLIPRSGGELRLKNGTVRLQIAPNALDTDKEMFWIFRPLADTDENESSNLAVFEPHGQTLQNADDIVKYSLPVVLGPAGVAFRTPVVLTLKEYSFPDWTSSGELSVYRRTHYNGNWERVGSCFLDKSSRTATVPLTKFSSYVLGMPAKTELQPLNVHIMVQSLSQKKGDTSKPGDIRVVFFMNDYTYIQEMVLRKRMNILCETSHYLDPKSDVNIRWEKRNADGSVYLKQTVVLEKGRLNRLAEKMQSVTIPIQDEQKLVEDRDIFVILEQHDTVLVELLCRDDRPMKKEETTPKGKEVIHESGIPRGTGFFDELITNVSLCCMWLIVGGDRTHHHRKHPPLNDRMVNVIHRICCLLDYAEENTSLSSTVSLTKTIVKYIEDQWIEDAIDYECMDIRRKEHKSITGWNREDIKAVEESMLTIFRTTESEYDYYRGLQACFAEARRRVMPFDDALLTTLALSRFDELLENQKLIWQQMRMRDALKDLIRENDEEKMKSSLDSMFGSGKDVQRLLDDLWRMHWAWWEGDKDSGLISVVLPPNVQEKLEEEVEKLHGRLKNILVGDDIKREWGNIHRKIAARPDEESDITKKVNTTKSLKEMTRGSTE